jgi:hypothetical protein
LAAFHLRLSRYHRGGPELSPMNEPLAVYLFRDPRFAPAGDTAVCVAPLDLVVSVYGGGGHAGAEGLAAAFAGVAMFRNEETGARYLGVWGARKASRFRNALRARAALNVIREPPPARLAWFETRPPHRRSDR